MQSEIGKPLGKHAKHYFMRFSCFSMYENDNSSHFSSKYLTEDIHKSNIAQSNQCLTKYLANKQQSSSVNIFLDVFSNKIQLTLSEKFENLKSFAIF